MKKVIRLTERDLTRVVKRIINEMDIESRESHRHSASMFIDEMDDIVDMIGSVSSNEVLKELSHIVDMSRRKLSDEEFDKVVDYYDYLESQISFSPDYEDEEDYDDDYDY